MHYTFGARVRLLRARQHMTQNELARRLSVTPQAVSRWETDRTCPDIMTLYPLARVLNASLYDLLSPEFSAMGGECR